MKSSKPYIIRGLYEWILDNNCTPQVIVATNVEGVQVPQKFINEDRIVLNIAPTATHNLRIGNDALECKARFGGISHDLYVPIEAVIAIYARENDQGMIFSQQEESPQQLSRQKSKPKLSVIQGGLDA